LEAARLNTEAGFFAQGCFLCRQAGEKALKAFALASGVAQVCSHSIRRIALDLGIDGEVEEAGRDLDVYYIAARYPDGLPEGAPFQAFSLRQAQNALTSASDLPQK